MQCRDNNSGFTLIELLIAIMILSVGLMGLYTLIIGTIQGTRFNKNHMTATVLARDMMERISNDDYADVTPAEYPQQNYYTMPDYKQFQRTVTIADNTPELDTKTITVTVSWRNSSGTTRNITLDTIIAL